MKSAEERAAEHDRLNEAGWRNYRTSTSSFPTKCHPSFRLSQKEASHSPGENDVMLYFLRFRSKSVPTYTFLKIGISNRKDIRFDFDSDRFWWEALYTIFKLSRKKALAIEADILKRFKHYSQVPSIKLLSGGNSECFRDDVRAERKIIDALDKISGKARPKIEMEIEPRIHSLMRLIDYKDALILDQRGSIIEYNHIELARILQCFRGNLKGLGVKNIPTIETLLKHFLTKIRR